MENKSQIQNQDIEIIPKQSIVHVIRKTRGKFPGEKAPVDTVGLVWTSWIAGSFGTHKVSVITKDLKLYFTTAACTSVLGELDNVKGFENIRSDWAAKHFIPIVLTAVDLNLPGAVKKDEKRKAVRSNDWMGTPISARVSRSNNKEYVRCLTLDKKTIYVKQSYCHPEDWKSLISGIRKGEKVFCLRLEPWILEKAEII